MSIKKLLYTPDSFIGEHTMLNEQDFRKRLSSAILQLRYKHKYSIEKLAELSNADYSSVSLIENGKQSPKSYTLYKILYALNIDMFKQLEIKSDNKNKHSLENKLIQYIKDLNEEQLYALIEFLETYTIVKHRKTDI